MPGIVWHNLCEVVNLTSMFTDHNLNGPNSSRWDPQHYDDAPGHNDLEAWFDCTDVYNY